MENVTDHTPPFAATEILPPNPGSCVTPPFWSPLQRLGFRIAFIYFFCFMFLYGNGSLLLIIYMLPVVGGKIGFAFTWPTNHLAEIIGKHMFHLTGITATWHGTGSGDTALNWILNGIFISAALIGGLIWTGVSALRGNRRTEYALPYAWLRFFLRLTVGMFMIGYGMGKVFPMQMQPISIAVLNEPLGQSSPMTMLWSLIALHPLYESICGLAEVIGGVLMFFRRTALLGTLISAFVMINVLLYNIFFDVPVKLFAFNLLLAMLFLALPDVTPLFRFFGNMSPQLRSAFGFRPLKDVGFASPLAPLNFSTPLSFSCYQLFLSELDGIDIR